VRDAAAGGAAPLEVLMVERHEGMGFAGGASVFPGGKIDPADQDAGWLALADGLDGLEPMERAARVACVREAFEEAGMLVARDQAGQLVGEALCQRLSPLRADVVKRAGLFAEMVRVEGLRLACDTLVRFARWIPPEGLHKRFDTWFFLTPTPPGQVPLEDGLETTAFAWLRPVAALEDLAAGTRKIIFPTARNLELLGLSATVADALADAAARPQEIVQPVMVQRADGAFLTIPTHLGYPVTEERLETALRG
jgi:8-oxo-dGTP pyrophosphatase MutT (NUDIX family)